MLLAGALPAVSSAQPSNSSALIVARSAPIPMLLPGSPLLIPPTLAGGGEHFVVFIKRVTGDTTEQRMSEVRREQRTVAGHGDQVALASTWSPPFVTIDTVVIERRGLAPVTEHLEFRGAFTYQYAHRHVTGTIQRQDSAAHAFDQTFAQDIFAFSEVDLLVRCLPFQPGLSVVVPLFSESDAAQELDTMTVVGPDSATLPRRGWVVRFADPAIVTRYVIDEQSRATLSAETTQRRTGAHIRYEPTSEEH